MSADILLSRLVGVRQSAPTRWIAKCPGHEDKTPSLSIRELEDGRVLLHDFGGCSAADVISAVGLTMADLFPAPLTSPGDKPARPNHWHAAREAVRTLHREVLIVAIAAENIAAGVKLDEADRELVVQAASKIRATAEICT